MPAVTKKYRTLYTPPIPCDQIVKAETMIAAGGFRMPLRSIRNVADSSGEAFRLMDPAS